MSRCPWAWVQLAAHGGRSYECSLEAGHDGVHSAAREDFTWTNQSTCAVLRCSHAMAGVPCCDEKRAALAAPPVTADDEPPPVMKIVLPEGANLKDEPHIEIRVEKSGADPVPPFTGKKRSKNT